MACTSSVLCAQGLAPAPPPAACLDDEQASGQRTLSEYNHFHSRLHADLPAGAEGGHWHAWPRPDPDQFPLFGRAKGTEFLVEAGDSLYIPAGYWHWVFSEQTDAAQPIVALNVWTHASQHTTKQPFLARQNATSWPAMKRWTAAYLAQHARLPRPRERGQAGKVAVLACCLGRHLYPEFFMDKHRNARDIDLDEFMSLVQDAASSASCIGLLSQPLDEGLLEDVPYLKLWGTSNPHNTHQANLWLGKGTYQSGLHFDEYHNTNTVLRGRKRFIVFAPDQTQFLYPANPALVHYYMQALHHDVVVPPGEGPLPSSPSRFKPTCPEGGPMCSPKNQCDVCHASCGAFCQNTDSACEADDCVTCSPGFHLRQVFEDSTGVCEPGDTGPELLPRVTKSFKVTCPQFALLSAGAECSNENQCQVCHESCQYCQNTGSPECGKEDCITCRSGYTLKPLYGDGSGSCDRAWGGQEEL